MGVLESLWVAARTKNISDAATDKALVLIINELGVDKLQEKLAGPSQKSKIWEVHVQGRDIHVENLTNSSIRIGITGDDAWAPEHVLIWGQEATGKIVPIAAEWLLETKLSTDTSEGKLTFPLRRINFPTINANVGILDKTAEIKQLLVITSTADVTDAGTDNQIACDILYGGGQKWSDQGLGGGYSRGKSSMLFPITIHHPPPHQQRWNTLESLSLKILGDDQWVPEKFFLFGFRSSFQEPIPGVPWGPPPDSIMPLVHIPHWGLGPMSKDSSEGKESVSLPLLPVPDSSVGPA
jgi:hypothetical protein